ncbi:hypothetical protein PPERSA_10645 [Pseudocohnilembus persalinus]|uniref:Acyl-coenzyme A thioesterase THEM4 n=1 Tax=Pseudocohnilembus persalinus TaxID=266149 RepID=A0A0V0QD88_PSEPJ|nr:hypothetical protein PPERSA_10645 [Pseudocohnilembus persalinus]|eukprot:KRX00146.1 hypothetical protein PPERSA_10645 [Pseudocohnilembus persalinus]
MAKRLENLKNQIDTKAEAEKLQQLSQQVQNQKQEQKNGQNENNILIEGEYFYSGVFKKFLDENNFGYEKLDLTMRQMMEQNEKYKWRNFLSYYVQEQLNGFTLRTFYNRILLQKKLNVNQKFGEYDENEVLKFAKTAKILIPHKSTQGHIGKVHGGFTASIIDESMGQLVAIFQAHKMAATTHLNLKYKQPVYLEQEYLIITQVLQADEKDIVIQCDIYDKNMRIAVSATGKFRRLIDNPNFSQSKKLISFKDFCGKLPNLKEIIEEEEDEDE